MSSTSPSPNASTADDDPSDSTLTPSPPYSAGSPGAQCSFPYSTTGSSLDQNKLPMTSGTLPLRILRRVPRSAESSSPVSPYTPSPVPPLGPSPLMRSPTSRCPPTRSQASLSYLEASPVSNLRRTTSFHSEMEASLSEPESSPVSTLRRPSSTQSETGVASGMGHSTPPFTPTTPLSPLSPNPPCSPTSAPEPDDFLYLDPPSQVSTIAEDQAAWLQAMGLLDNEIDAIENQGEKHAEHAAEAKRRQEHHAAEAKRREEHHAAEAKRRERHYASTIAALKREHATNAKRHEDQHGSAVAALKREHAAYIARLLCHAERVISEAAGEHAPLTAEGDRSRLQQEIAFALKEHPTDNDTYPAAVITLLDKFRGYGGRVAALQNDLSLKASQASAAQAESNAREADLESALRDSQTRAANLQQQLDVAGSNASTPREADRRLPTTPPSLPPTTGCQATYPVSTNASAPTTSIGRSLSEATEVAALRTALASANDELATANSANKDLTRNLILANAKYTVEVAAHRDNMRLLERIYDVQQSISAQGGGGRCVVA